MKYQEIHRAAAERSAAYGAMHAESCPVHVQCDAHVEAVADMLDIAATGAVPSSTRRLPGAPDGYYGPAWDGDARLDRAILRCQDEHPVIQVDGFGERCWTWCTCGNQKSFPRN